MAAAEAKVAAAEKVALVAAGVPGKAEVDLAILVAAGAMVHLVAGQAPLAILLAAVGEMHLPPRHKCN